MSATYALHEQAVKRAEKALEMWAAKNSKRYIPPKVLTERLERQEKILDALRTQFYGSARTPSSNAAFNAINALGAENKRGNAIALQNYRNWKPRGG